MKKIILLFPLYFLFSLNNTIKAQLIVKKTTATERRRLDSLSKAPVLKELTAAQKSEAKDYANAFTAFIIKAVLHKADPAKYPMDAPAGSMEKRSMDFINTLSAAQLQKATNKVNATIVDQTKKKKILGKYSTLDFSKASTTAELKRMDDKLHFSKTADRTMAPPYTRIEFIIRGLYCIKKTTSPESYDQILIGGLLSGLNNEVFPATTLVAGEYADGSSGSGAVIFGGADLHPEQSFPKTFYSYLLVIEYDGLNINEDAGHLNNQMQSLANDLSGLDENEAFYHNYVEFSLENAAQIGFWDDALNVTVVPVVLTNLNSFGPDKVSDDMNTGDIYGWGGQYQIVYNWRIIKN